MAPGNKVLAETDGSWCLACSPCSQWWQRERQQPGEETTYGGFYTQEDVKEALAYAAKRYVRVIPEIDVPGHSVAALVAYRNWPV